jgi:hypothetical protein
VSIEIIVLCGTQPLQKEQKNQNIFFYEIFYLFYPEAVFLVSLRLSSFPAGNEVYGKSIDSLFLAGNKLTPSSFPAWLKMLPLESNVGHMNILGGLHV